MKLRGKILSGFLILAGMLATAGILSIIELRSIGTSVDRLLNDNYKSINAARKMLEALEMVNSGVLLAVSGNRRDGMPSIEAGDRLFQQSLETAGKNLTIPNEERYVARIADAYGRYKTAWSGAIESGAGERPLEWYSGVLRPKYQTACKAVDALLQLNDKSMYTTASRLYAQSNRAIMPGIVAVLSALVFVVIFNYFIHCYVITPIVRLTREIRENTLSRAPLAVEIETQDEIRDLAAAIKDLSVRQRRAL